VAASQRARRGCFPACKEATGYRLHENRGVVATHSRSPSESVRFTSSEKGAYASLHGRGSSYPSPFGCSGAQCVRLAASKHRTDCSLHLDGSLFTTHGRNTPKRVRFTPGKEGTHRGLQRCRRVYTLSIGLSCTHGGGLLAGKEGTGSGLKSRGSVSTTSGRGMSQSIRFAACKESTNASLDNLCGVRATRCRRTEHFVGLTTSKKATDARLHRRRGDSPPCSSFAAQRFGFTTSKEATHSCLQRCDRSHALIGSSPPKRSSLASGEKGTDAGLHHGDGFDASTSCLLAQHMRFTTCQECTRRRLQRNGGRFASLGSCTKEAVSFSPSQKATNGSLQRCYSGDTPAQITRVTPCEVATDYRLQDDGCVRTSLRVS